METEVVPGWLAVASATQALMHLLTKVTVSDEHVHISRFHNMIYNSFRTINSTYIFLYKI